MLLLVFQTLEMLTVSEEILLTLAVKVVLFSLLVFLSLFFSATVFLWSLAPRVLSVLYGQLPHTRDSQGSVRPAMLFLSSHFHPCF